MIPDWLELPASLPVTLVLWIGGVSLATFALFGWDKWRAMRGGWRVPEARLLFLALVGGSPGAKLAQARFRHKTRKEPFRTYLNAIVLLQMIGLSTMADPAVRKAVIDILSGI